MRGGFKRGVNFPVSGTFLIYLGVARNSHIFSILHIFHIVSDQTFHFPSGFKLNLVKNGDFPFNL